MPTPCIVGCPYPAFWRAFCWECAKRLGVAGRRAVDRDGRKGVQRAVERLRAAYASCKVFGGSKQ